MINNVKRNGCIRLFSRVAGGSHKRLCLIVAKYLRAIGNRGGADVDTNIIRIPRNPKLSTISTLKVNDTNDARRSYKIIDHPGLKLGKPSLGPSPRATARSIPLLPVGGRTREQNQGMERQGKVCGTDESHPGGQKPSDQGPSRRHSEQTHFCASTIQPTCSSVESNAPISIKPLNHAEVHLGSGQRLIREQRILHQPENGS